ncbi:MAG: hypothetical protein GF311_14835 [Candidatus Lokiarchaeota archaeon]|nr:hypothetical protein [Candidatus Lokiarchaeota archaeon]
MGNHNEFFCVPKGEKKDNLSSKLMKDKWFDFHKGWQLKEEKDETFYYLLRIQENLQCAIYNILGFLNGFISNIFKYSDFYISLEKEAYFSMSKKMDLELNQEFREAFSFSTTKLRNTTRSVIIVFILVI